MAGQEEVILEVHHLWNQSEKRHCAIQFAHTGFEFERALAEKRNQHFIPRFYLKLFATDPGERMIGLFNVRTKKHVANASIRHQASADFYYGRDGVVEDVLCKLENSWRPTVRNILRDQQLPAAGSESAFHLLMLMLNLSARTAQAADEQVEMLEKFSKIILSKAPQVQGHIDSFKLRMAEPNLIPMETAFSMAFVMFDMRSKLLLNRTGRPFITSDNPVVRTNPFLESLSPHSSNTGFACKGLQVFMPLSPMVQLVYYDGSVYKFGSLGPRSVDVTVNEDVDSLNLLQCLSTNENLYFNSMAPSEVERLLLASEPFRRSQKAAVTEYPSLDGSPDSIIHSQRQDPRCGLNLSFVRILEKARRYMPQRKAVHVRNQRLCDIEHGLFEAVHSGKLTLAEAIRQIRRSTNH